jgi:hypothetical protein
MFDKSVPNPRESRPLPREVNPDAEVQDDANVIAMEDVDMISELGNISELQDAPDGSRHTVELVVEKKQDGFNLVSTNYTGSKEDVSRDEYFSKTPEEQAAIDEKQVMGRKPMGGNRAV